MMPKCSGPTFCTRGWITPRGFCRNSCDLAFLRVRLTDIGLSPEKGLWGIPSPPGDSLAFFPFGSKPTYQVSGTNDIAMSVANHWFLTPLPPGTFAPYLCPLPLPSKPPKRHRRRHQH